LQARVTQACQPRAVKRVLPALAVSRNRPQVPERMLRQVPAQASWMAQPVPLLPASQSSPVHSPGV